MHNQQLLQIKNRAASKQHRWHTVENVERWKHRLRKVVSIVFARKVESVDLAIVPPLMKRRSCAVVTKPSDDRTVDYHLHVTMLISSFTHSIPSPPRSFIPGLKRSFSANPSHRSLPFLLQDWLHRFLGLFTDTSEHICFLLFSFSVFPLFSCWFNAAIKLTHVSFWLGKWAILH